jgi:hypothetical protein
LRRGKIIVTTKYEFGKWSKEDCILIFVLEKGEAGSYLGTLNVVQVSVVYVLNYSYHLELDKLARCGKMSL